MYTSVCVYIYIYTHTDIPLNSTSRSKHELTFQVESLAAQVSTSVLNEIEADGQPWWWRAELRFRVSAFRFQGLGFRVQGLGMLTPNLEPNPLSPTPLNAFSNPRPIFGPHQSGRNSLTPRPYTVNLNPKRNPKLEYLSVSGSKNQGAPSLTRIPKIPTIKSHETVQQDFLNPKCP